MQRRHKNKLIRFGKMLKKDRLNRNMTYQQLSDSTGLTVSLLYNLENGFNDIKLSVLIKLCKSLDLNIYDMIDFFKGEKK